MGKKKKKDSSPAGLCTIRGIHCETRFNGEIRRWNSSFENERLHACMAVSSVSHIRENSDEGSSIVDQGFLVREIAAKSRSLPNGRRNVARRSFRSRALIRGEKSASLSLSRTIALTDGEKTIEGKSRRRNGERSGRKVRKKKERKGKKRRSKGKKW